MKVRELMTTKVGVVSEDTSVAELAKVLAKHQITGAPVVDEQKKLVGVVSLSDVARSAPADGPHKVCYYANPSWSGVDIPESDQRRVGDIMTHIVIHVDAEDELERAAELMVNHGIHRVIVTHQKKIVGVITSMDMVKEFLERMRAAKQLR